jgi:predicted nuclease of restriction endonuclease-like RecB superfamily
LLPASLLSLDPTGPRTYAPRYLTGRDDVWIRHACDQYTDRLGFTVDELQVAWTQKVESLLIAEGATRQAVRGFKWLLDRHHETEVDSPVTPRELRKCVFESAARGLSLEAIAEAVSRHWCAVNIDDALYADRTQSQRVRGSRALNPIDLRYSYNLALVQGILLRSHNVRIAVSEHVRPVVRMAKLRGLIIAAVDDQAATILELSGPLALFRRTMMYGRALASFFPTLVSTPRFALTATAFVSNRIATVMVSHDDPLPRTHALPREFDSAVERALIRNLRRCSTHWQIVRESDVIRAGPHLFFPDFALQSGDLRIQVEIVGFYTADYLERKLCTLRAARTTHPFIVCIDESLNCGAISMPAEHVVLRYKKRVDAGVLLRAAEEIRQRTPPAPHVLRSTSL